MNSFSAHSVSSGHSTSVDTAPLPPAVLPPPPPAVALPPAPPAPPLGAPSTGLPSQLRGASEATLTLARRTQLLASAPAACPMSPVTSSTPQRLLPAKQQPGTLAPNTVSIGQV